MKFLKRSGQSNTPNNNSAVQIPIPSAVPTPSTPLANKELPPTPLFARYARTASGSFDSLGAGSNGLTPPNTGRIYGNSAGSGGSNLWVNSQSSFVLGPDGTPLVGGARDSGYSGSSGRVNSYARPEDEPPKEPIKLGRRPYSTTGAVDITKSVIVPAKSRRSSVLPDKPGNVFSNFDHRIPVPPPLPEKNSPELNIQPKLAPVSTFNAKVETKVTLISTSRSSTLPVPNPVSRPSPIKEKYDGLAGGESFEFYEAAIRLADAPVPTPASPSAYTRPPAQEESGDILVKPPSRRDSLKPAARAALEAANASSARPITPEKRTPSPIKRETSPVPPPKQPTLTPFPVKPRTPVRSPSPTKESSFPFSTSMERSPSPVKTTTATVPTTQRSLSPTKVPEQIPSPSSNGVTPFPTKVQAPSKLPIQQVQSPIPVKQVHITTASLANKVQIQQSLSPSHVQIHRSSSPTKPMRAEEGFSSTGGAPAEKESIKLMNELAANLKAKEKSRPTSMLNSKPGIDRTSRTPSPNKEERGSGSSSSLATPRPLSRILPPSKPEVDSPISKKLDSPSLETPVRKEVAPQEIVTRAPAARLSPLPSPVAVTTNGTNGPYSPTRTSDTSRTNGVMVAKITASGISVTPKDVPPAVPPPSENIKRVTLKRIAKSAASPEVKTAPEQKEVVVALEKVVPQISQQVPPSENLVPSRQGSSASVASSSTPSATQSRSTAPSPSHVETPGELDLDDTEGTAIKKLNELPVHEPHARPIHDVEPVRTIPVVQPKEIPRMMASEQHIVSPPAPVAFPQEIPLEEPNQESRSSHELMQPRPMYHVREWQASVPLDEHEAAVAGTPPGQLPHEVYYPIEEHLMDPTLLAALMPCIGFSEWAALSAISKKIREMVEERRELREVVLSRFLGTVGYVTWDFGKKREPLQLTLKDLNSYLRGVSIPIHRYSEIAEGQAASNKEGKSRIVRLLASSTRAYSKVVLRLRAQAEAEAFMIQASQAASISSRPTSPLTRAQQPPSGWGAVFHSPLYRVGHAPLLRVFVPSPDSAWLSDESVMACEKELKRAGILSLLKVGDVVWDTAVSDDAGFGNAGRLIWDGNYLIDLDYSYSAYGDIPMYIHSLSFPPSYFHRVLRSNGSPIMQLDLRPWGREIAANIQLLQDRGHAEGAHGGKHAVMRWTHRSRFQVVRHTPIPDTNVSVDPSWEGQIVIEAEGTNEGLLDLQLRCGMECFKPQPGVQPKPQEGSRVFRFLRDRSRPGEIWLRAVRAKA